METIHVVTMVTLWLLCSLVHLALTGGADFRVTTQCIIGHQATELYLNCEDGGLINILSTHMGNQEVPEDIMVCVERAPDSCVFDIPDVDPLYRACMGSSSCNQVMYSPGDDQCGNPVNYVQVKYQCIPVSKAEKHAVVDVCGDSGATIRRSQGYIESWNYPNNYLPETSCSCNITALDPSTNIHLTVLDMDLSMDPRITMGHDWLEFTSSMDHWGDGQKLNAMNSGDKVDTGSALVYLNFRTDAGKNGRGFWIQYQGVTPTGNAGELRIHCGHYTPPDYRRDMSCYGDSHIGEMYLTCQSHGVINILSAVHGYNPAVTLDNCTGQPDYNCTESATQDEALLKTCMGQITCNPPARAIDLSCGSKSNYMLILYQCIQETNQGPYSRIDMCGDATQTRTITRRMGYLETLNYPEGYFPNQMCTCRLQAVQDNTEIVLSLVDLNLDNGDCTRTKDWIEFTVGKQNWAKGVRLCGNVPGETIHTGAQKLYLNFFSDQSTEGRGVWLKYMGKAADGSLTKLKVACGHYSPYQDLPDEVSKIPPYLTGPNTRKIPKSNDAGLIAGLTITAVFMVAIITVMLIYKYRRPKKKHTDENVAPGGPPSAIARLDTGYGTLKYPGFSTKKNGHGLPYTNLDEEPTGTLKAQNNFRDTSPIIPGAMASTRAECSSSSNASSSSSNASEPTSVRSEIAYNNPAFEGNWERDHEYFDNVRNVAV